MESKIAFDNEQLKPRNYSGFLFGIACSVNVKKV